ncbi:MAG: hypothetical protein WC889_17455, partial [Myxococcota bacterium]
FDEGGVKLGLGSSAAVTVCAAASVMYEAGMRIGDAMGQRRLWDVAREVHNRFQGVRGSGIDIAASVYGGCVRLGDDGDGAGPRISGWALPDGVKPIFLWTGVAASTTALLAAVNRYESDDRDGHAELFGELHRVAGGFADAGSSDHDRALGAFREYGDLMAELGRRAKAPVVSGVMTKVMQAAVDAGGAAKPSGAGGGDFMVALIPDDGDAAGFLERCRILGLRRYAFNEDVCGVRVAGQGELGNG